MTASFPTELKQKTTNTHIVRTVDIHLGANYPERMYVLVQKKKFIASDSTLTDNIHDALLFTVADTAPSKKVKLDIQYQLNIHPSAWDGFLEPTNHIEIVQVYNKG